MSLPPHLREQYEGTTALARAYIELPDGWGPGRVIIGACERAGYGWEELRDLATGERQLILSGQPRSRMPPGGDRPGPESFVARRPAARTRDVSPRRQPAGRAPNPAKPEVRTVPPVVRYEITQAPSFLLRWERLPDGRWGARIAWVEITSEGAWVVRGGVAPASTVHQMPGQDYRAVPRDPRPRDETDPRDPGYNTRLWPPPAYEQDPNF